MKFGVPFVATSGVVLKGSPLFDEKTISEFKLTPGAETICDCIVTDAKTGALLFPLKMRVFRGMSGLAFKGDVWNSLLEVDFKINSSGPRITSEISLEFDANAWNGLLVGKLPYFDKVRKFFIGLTQREGINFKFEKDGHELKSFDHSVGSENAYIESIKGFVDYWQKAIFVAQETGVLIQLNSTLPNDVVDYTMAEVVYQVIKNGKSECQKPLCFEMQVSESSADGRRRLVDLLLQCGVLRSCNLYPNDILKAFGVTIPSSDLVAIISGVDLVLPNAEDFLLFKSDALIVQGNGSLDTRLYVGPRNDDNKNFIVYEA